MLAINSWNLPALHTSLTKINESPEVSSITSSFVAVGNSSLTPPPLPLTPPPAKSLVSKERNNWSLLLSGNDLGPKAQPNEKPVIIQTTRDAIYRYTLHHEKTNNALREGRVLNPFLEQCRSDMDTFFEDNRNNKSFKTTYRGLDEYNPYAGCQVGDVVSDKAYLSTSLSEEIAKAFTSINANSTLVTVKGWSGVDISDISAKKHEQEVLYPRNTLFIIIENSPERVVIEEIKK